MKWDRGEERYMCIFNWPSWAWIRWFFKSTVNPNHGLVFGVSSQEGWCRSLGFRELSVCDHSLAGRFGCSLWERVEGPCRKVCHHHPRLERCPLRLFFQLQSFFCIYPRPYNPSSVSTQVGSSWKNKNTYGSLVPGEQCSQSLEEPSRFLLLGSHS